MTTLRQGTLRAWFRLWRPCDFATLAFLAFLVSVLFASGAPLSARAAEQVECGDAPPIAEYPEGYAPPIDPASQASLLSAMCTTGEDAGEAAAYAAMTLGDGKEGTLVYHKVYAWDGAQWRAFEVEGNRFAADQRWVVRQGKVSVPLASISPWVVGYVCRWDEGEQRWRCGCRDSECASSGWQVLYVTPPGVPAYCATHRCPLPPGAPFIDFVDGTSEQDLRRSFPNFRKKIFRTAYNMGFHKWETLVDATGVLRDLSNWIASDPQHWSQYVIELFPWRYPEPTSKQYEVEAIQAQFHDCLAGKFDQYYRRLGERIREAGIKERFVLSLGPEWNFGHTTASVSKNPQLLAPLYAKCFNRAVKQIRAGAQGVQMYIAWVGGGKWNDSLVRAAYPGDDVVDIIGTDIYDLVAADCSAHQKYSTGWQECRWRVFLNQYLLGWQQFAKAHGKWLAIPEWGLWPTNDPPYDTLTTWDGDDNRNYGGGDNPTFIKNMCLWAKQQDNVLYILYFRYQSRPGLSITNYPRAMDAFNRYCAH